MGKIQRLKQQFMEHYWVEGRHEDLKEFSEADGKLVLDSLNDDEVWVNVNNRKFQEAYICDFLEDVWFLNPAAFWRHIKAALQSEDGLIISDNNFHISVMEGENIPEDVWPELLDCVRQHADTWVVDRHIDIVFTQLKSGREDVKKRISSWLKSLQPDERAVVIALFAKELSKEDLGEIL